MTVFVWSSSPDPASAASKFTSPSKLRNDLDSRLASDGKTLWLATTGFASKKEKTIHTQVVALKNGIWKRLPGSPRSSTDTALQAVARTSPKLKTEPCIGFTDPTSQPRIRCFVKGKWQDKPIAKSLRDFHLEGMTADGRTLTAMFRKLDGRNTQVRVARMKHGRFVPFGPPLIYKFFVVAQVGLKTTNAASDRRIDLLISTDYQGTQWVATLKGSRWTRTSKVPRKGFASLLTGSVRTRRSLFVPSTTGYPAKDWPFSIFRNHAGSWSEVGNEPLSDLDASQGGIDPAGNEIWATWGQQERPEIGSLFPTKQWAARVSPSGKSFNKRVLLWEGGRSFPGQQQTVEYQGAPAFLYIRQFSKKGPTRATVDLSLSAR